MVRVPVRYAFISLFLPLSVFSTLKCELYIAESSIPNAGIGIFSGVSKHKGDTIGNGDKAIPLIDIYINNDYFLDGRNNPTEDYIWDGKDLGMGLETFGVDGVSTFWPGIDAMVNSHLALMSQRLYRFMTRMVCIDGSTPELAAYPLIMLERAW